MDTGLVLAVLLAIAFATTNGLHDASNAIATLVATRAAKPSQAIVLAAAFNLLGPFVIGAAVADTIAGIVTVPPEDATAVIGAGLAAAVGWNLVTWYWGLPSSSGNALVGGLVGAALIEGGTGAVNWGGFDGLRPVGVIGALVALAISPPLGALGALIVIRALRRAARRATRRWHGPVNGGQWVTSAALAFSHGANDAQKSIGVIAALLLAAGEISTLSAPTWAVFACAAALTIARGGPCQPERIGGRDLRRLAARRPDFHHAGRRLVARRDRRRAGPASPRPLAPRAEDGVRLAHHHPDHGPPRHGRVRDLELGVVKSSHWFLPETPDVIGGLRRQVAATVEGMEAFAAWAHGDEGAADRLREARRESDAARRDLVDSLRAAFVTPLEPEDAFTLSRGIDRIIGHALDLVGEAQVMDSPPDSGVGQMADLLAQAVRRISEAIGHLGSDSDAATAAADGALETERVVAKAYYQGMAALLEVDDMRERISRRELYRRCARIGEGVVDVAERVQYAIVKQL